MPMWIVSRGDVLLILLGLGYRVLIDLILHRSAINNSASLSNKFGEFYFIFKFGISGYFTQSGTAMTEYEIVAYDKNFSCIWLYTSMMLPRVRNHHGGKHVYGLLHLVWFVKYSACVRRIVADVLQRIALLCGRKYLVRESDKIEKYVGGLPDMIHGSVVASKPKTIQDAVEIATELMDKKIRNFMSENFHTEIK
ncbi:hypothetical protein Tco_0033794 [Tanacetum coccineum]